MKLAGPLQRISDWTGRIVAWAMLPMVVVQFVIVLLRYVFDVGWIWMQEGVLWMHAAVFMLASAYTLACDEHVRVDIFYRDMSPGRKRLVDAGGTLLLLLPMMIFLIVVSFDYVAVSWSIREGSREAGGLPYPFVPLLKTMIPVTAALVVVQGIASLLGQFAGGGHDQGAQGSAFALDQAVQDRQGKRGRLAGAGLGQAHDVAAFHDRGNGLGLDGGGGGVAGGRDAGRYTGVKVK